MKLVLSLLFTLGAGAVVGWITSGESSSDWYLQLNKPWFNPPGWVFGVIWPILYIMMGISLFVVWKLPASSLRNRSLTLFFTQLVLNLIWNPIFFELKDIGLALFDIVVLWIALLATIIFFSRVSKAAGWLLVPYVLWVSFAMLLTFTIWSMN